MKTKGKFLFHSEREFKAKCVTKGALVPTFSLPFQHPSLGKSLQKVSGMIFFLMLHFPQNWRDISSGDFAKRDNCHFLKA